MIVGLLANKVALSPKLVKSLIRSIAEIAREDAKDLTDLQWLRLSLMALINLVQVSLFLGKCLGNTDFAINPLQTYMPIHILWK